MISRIAIQKIAEKHQTTELNIRREYFQHLFLSLFYQQDKMERVYFKGGTALRFLYGSPRFSEDLDFDSSPKNVTTIESAVITVLSEAMRDGITTELDEAKETSGGYLSTMRFIGNGDTVPIRIEISFRDRTKKGETAFITSDFFPDYTIEQLSEDQLVEGKIHAMLSRKKPRDFYDFYFLLRHNMIHEKKKEVFEAVLQILQDRSLNFDGLKEFLPRNHHLIIHDFKGTLEREIKKYL